MIFNPNLVLCCTSLGFFATSFFGRKQQNILYNLDTANAICSLLYWCNPTNKYKMVLDIVVSNICGFSFFVYGYKYINHNLMRKIAYINGVMMVTLFTSSCVMYSYNNPYWIGAHTMFHIVVIANKMIVYSF